MMQKCCCDFCEGGRKNCYAVQSNFRLIFIYLMPVGRVAQFRCIDHRKRTVLDLDQTSSLKLPHHLADVIDRQSGRIRDVSVAYWKMQRLATHHAPLGEFVRQVQYQPGNSFMGVRRPRSTANWSDCSRSSIHTCESDSKSSGFLKREALTSSRLNLR